MKPPRSVPALQRRVRKQVTIRPEFEAFRPSVNPEMNQKMYQMKEDVPLINYRVGINVNPSLVAIPCMTIAERNNVVVMGKGVGFDSTEYNLQPISWKSKLAFVPERLGVTADFQQKDHLAISSYVR